GYNYSYRYWFNHLTLDRRFLDTASGAGDRQQFRYDQDNFALFNFSNHIANAGVDYSLGNRTTLGMAVSGSTNNFNPEADNKSRALDGNDALIYDFLTTGRHQNFYYNYAVNLNLRHQFDSSGRELSIDADYAAFGNQSKQNFSTEYKAPDGSTYQPDYFLKSDLKGITSIRSVKADYKHPFRNNTRLELGFKSSFTTADNNPLFFEKINGNYELDTRRSNHFIYEEQINAAYMNFQHEFPRWSTQIGLRMENTNA